MSFSKYSKIPTFLMFSISLVSILSAKLEQKMLPVNKENKKVTFTFYHFDSSKSVTLTNINKNLGDTAKQQNSKAAITASATTEFSYLSGKFVFPTTSTSYLIKDRAISNSAKSPRSSKHTFILTDNKDRHAICYAPSTNQTELIYALKQYLATSKTQFKTAVIIHSGNQSGFYKTNGDYRPYYLKELKMPPKALLVK